MARKQQPSVCKHCTRAEAEHPLPWCHTFEPRSKGSRTSKKPEPVSLDYIQRTVRETLSKTLHYVADLLMLDPKLVTAATSQLLDSATRRAVKDVDFIATYSTGPEKIAEMLEPKSEPQRPVTPLNPDDVLDKAQHAVLTAVANFPEGLTAVRISLYTGYKQSTRNRILQELKSMGLITETNRGDKEKRTIHASDAGKNKLRGAGGIKPLPPRHATRTEWKSKLPAGNALVFDWLCKQFPHWIEKDRIDEQLDFATSTRNRMLQELKRWDLIEVDGTKVRAARDLFDINEYHSMAS